MIQEALQFIFDKADQAANPKASVRKIGSRTRVVTLGGVESTETIEPATVQRTAETLESLVALTDSYGNLPSVYVSKSGITVVLDDVDRTEFVKLWFAQSSQAEAMQAVEDGMKQKPLVNMLRTGLAGCVSGDAFTAIVRQLEFDVHRGSRGDFQNSKESLGHSVEKVVRANAGELPDTVSVTFPLLRTPSDINTHVSLTCAVILDLDNETVRLVPEGDSLDRERERVMSEIHERVCKLMQGSAVVVQGTVTVEALG